MEHVIENEKLKVSIADHGAEIRSVIRKSDGKEIMWQADRVGFNQKLEDREYGNTLGAGESFNAGYEMIFAVKAVLRAWASDRSSL